MANENRNQNGADERLKRNGAVDVRSDRESANAERELKDGTALTAQERRQQLRSEWVQNVLPVPPAIPGHHLCWLSTTNSTDPIYKRLQLGYLLVKQAEVEGFEAYSVSGGQYDGCVMCNEMLLAKVPLERYQDIMTVYHHDMPLEEESMLRESLTKGEEDREGRALEEVEGFDNIGKRKQPIFAN